MSEHPWSFVLNETARILVVDDDPILCEFAKVHLSTPDTSVDVVCDGLAAWERLNVERFDLALVDIDMPRLDGFGLLQKIRDDGRMWHMPIVMLTGREDIGSIDHSYELGATSFVTKPVNWRQLSYQLRYVLRNSRLEAEARRAKARAEELSSLKGNILSMMRHELPTPLNSILGFSQLIDKQIDGPVGVPSYQKYAGHIHEAARRLHEVLTDMIEYAQLSSGEAHLVDDEYQLGKIIDAAMSDAVPKAARASIPIELQMKERLSIVCDREQLVRTLRHLLDNAIVHGLGPICFTVGREIGGDLKISIADHGLGIRADRLASIDEPFGDARLTLARMAPGLGLGLPLARRVVELHDGKLEISTHEGMGTTVEITLPKSRLVGSRDAASFAARTLQQRFPVQKSA